METSSDKEKAIALLEKYKAGLCTPEEIDRIEHWYNSFRDSSDILNENEVQLAADDVARQVLIRLFEENKADVHGIKKTRAPYTFLRIAACLIAGCSLYFLSTKLIKKQPEISITYSKFSTGNGERKKIYLPDGSLVTLNVASAIQVPSNFGIKERDILLQGEAFFEVSKDKIHPFIIKTGKIQTRVVGTSFDIKAYTTENSIKIAVATGKVQVEKDEATGKKLIGKNLIHNDLLEYDVEKGTYSQSMADVDLLSAWRSNRLVFNHASITEIVRTIERVYNIPVVLIGKPRRQGLYTVTFNDYPLNKILPLLADLSGITYEMKQQQLIINIKNCK